MTTTAHADATGRGSTPETAPLGLVLHVSDIEKASRFYCSLGFAQTAAYPDSKGELTVAFLGYGTAMLLLGRRDQLHYENAERAETIRRGPVGLGAVITLSVPDLESVYAAVQRAGVQVLLEPVDEFYGDRVFMFLDPEGYEWKISQAITDVSAREVAEVIGRS